jgi:hypothetical protein
MKPLNRGKEGANVPFPAMSRPNGQDLRRECGIDSVKQEPPIPTRIPAQADDIQTLVQQVNYQTPPKVKRGGGK